MAVHGKFNSKNYPPSFTVIPSTAIVATPSTLTSKSSTEITTTHIQSTTLASTTFTPSSPSGAQVPKLTVWGVFLIVFCTFLASSFFFCKYFVNYIKPEIGAVKGVCGICVHLVVATRVSSEYSTGLWFFVDVRGPPDIVSRFPLATGLRRDRVSSRRRNGCLSTRLRRPVVSNRCSDTRK